MSEVEILERRWDVFVSYASEDRTACVMPLVEALTQRGLRVWYDEFEVEIGDSLREKIDEGLSRSLFGVVVLSQSFFANDWPRLELDGLYAYQSTGTRLILPVWHGVNRDTVRSFSPTLAGIRGWKTSEGVSIVADRIAARVLKSPRARKMKLQEDLIRAARDGSVGEGYSTDLRFVNGEPVEVRRHVTVNAQSVGTTVSFGKATVEADTR